MKNTTTKIAFWLGLPFTMLVASGCDAADIVFASLNLAGAIVDVAT